MKNRGKSKAKGASKPVPVTIIVDDSIEDVSVAKTPQSTTLGVYKSPLNWSWKKSSLMPLSSVAEKNFEIKQSVLGENRIDSINLFNSPGSVACSTPMSSKTNSGAQVFRPYLSPLSTIVSSEMPTTSRTDELFSNTMSDSSSPQKNLSSDLASSFNSVLTKKKKIKLFSNTGTVLDIPSPQKNHSSVLASSFGSERTKKKKSKLFSNIVPDNALPHKNHSSNLASSFGSELTKKKRSKIPNVDLINNLCDSLMPKKLGSERKIQMQSVNLVRPNSFANPSLSSEINEPTKSSKPVGTGNDERGLQENAKRIETFPETDESLMNLTSDVDTLTLLGPNCVRKKKRRRAKKCPENLSVSSQAEQEVERPRKKRKTNEYNTDALMQCVQIGAKKASPEELQSKVLFSKSDKDCTGSTLYVNIKNPSLKPAEKNSPLDCVVTVTNNESVGTTNLDETIIIEDDSISIATNNEKVFTTKLDETIIIIDDCISISDRGDSSSIIPNQSCGSNFLVTVRDDERTVNEILGAKKVPDSDEVICLDDEDSSDELTVLSDACPVIDKPLRTNKHSKRYFRKLRQSRAASRYNNEEVVIVRSKKSETKDEMEYLADLRRAHNIALLESQRMEKLLLNAQQTMNVDTDSSNTVCGPSYIPLIRNQKNAQEKRQDFNAPSAPPGSQSSTRPVRFPHLIANVITSHHYGQHSATGACVLPPTVENNEHVAYPMSPATPNVFGNNFSNPAKNVPKTGLRPVIIDGSNVAIGHGVNGSFSSRGLEICIQFFLKKGHKVFAFVPLFRRSHVQTTDSHILQRLEREQHLIFTPSRFIDGRTEVPYDDRYIVQTAAELGGVIVSKDNYRDLLSENPNYADVIKNRLLMFTWVGDMIMFPQDPLGRHGPNLEQFLQFNNRGKGCKY